MNKKYCTTITAKAELVEPNSQGFKTLASLAEEKCGFELKSQIDLLYVRSCLVSAGDTVGVNQNDDIFTREAAWAARQTPIIKPFNWQHNDKDILGVIYSVQARDTAGNTLDISDETVPDCDFDLWTEAVVYQLIHPERAAEIQARANAGTLYVSMEAWFDDYQYGFFSKADNSLLKVISRDSNTGFLDGHLRAAGGNGVYQDPDLGDVRVGRVLGTITYGGCGFVDKPANKRSVIELVEQMPTLANAEHEIKLLLEKIKVLESSIPEENIMNTSANTNNGSNADEVRAVVASEFDERERAAAEAREREGLQTRAANAEATAEGLEIKVQELTATQEQRDTEVEALKEQLAEYDTVVDSLVKEQTEAGATDSTPSEIAAIDAAGDGTAAFNAKIAWISKSAASLRERAARADELESQLAEAEAVVRDQDIRGLLSDHVSAEALEVFVTSAKDLSEDSYQSWRDEKELMVIEMSSARELSDKQKEAMKKEKDKKDGKKGGNPFAALLEERRTEAEGLINHPGGEDLKSGVNSGQLKTPRHKIAGSAEGDELNSVEADEKNIDLSGANTGTEGNVVSAFRVLAHAVTETKDVQDEGQGNEKPDFDPIK